MAPMYEDVLRGNTGHVEAVMVVWRQKCLSFTDILQMFLQCHDPCQSDGQGNDVGPHYRSGIFATSSEQRLVAKAALETFERDTGRRVATEIRDLESFHFAEQSHQQYFAKIFTRKYCSARVSNYQLPPAISWLPEDIRCTNRQQLGPDFWALYSPLAFSIHDSNEQIKLSKSLR